MDGIGYIQTNEHSMRTDYRAWSKAISSSLILKGLIVSQSETLSIVVDWRGGVEVMIDIRHNQKVPELHHLW